MSDNESGEVLANAALGLDDEESIARMSPGDVAPAPGPERTRREAFREEHHLPDGPLVYFVQEKSPQGFIKIGYATNLYGRLGALNTSNPYGVRLLAALPGYAELEAELHERFRDHHFRAEWFYPAGEVLEYAAECNARVTRHIPRYRDLEKSGEQKAKPPNLPRPESLKDKGFS